MTLGQATLMTSTKGIYFIKSRLTPPYGRGHLVLDHNVFDASVKGLDETHKGWENEEVEVIHGPDKFRFTVEKTADGILFVYKEGQTK